MANLVPETVVLRWGHRARDFRITSHVALTARALGAKGLVLSDVEDHSLQSSIESVIKSWGGTFFIEAGKSWKEIVQRWKREGGVVVHLTMYGENIEQSDLLDRLRRSSKKVLILVGSQKVPAEFYSDKISDFNVAVGNQPHSEVAALAVFLDKLYRGEELNQVFDNAKIRLSPSVRGKHVVEDQGVGQS